MTSEKKRIYPEIDIINKLLSLSCASCNIEDIKLPNRKYIRANLHILIYAPVGSGKSNILNMISEHKKTPILNGMTVPNLLGTWDKSTKKFFIPAFWRYRNNTLLIDEFTIPNSHDNENKNNWFGDFLKVLEDMKSNRLNTNSGETFIQKKKGLYCIAKDGLISLKTRLNFIGATMNNPYSHYSNHTTAISSRCVVIILKHEVDDILYLMNNPDIYKIEKIEIPLNFIITSQEYIFIQDYVKANVTMIEYFARTINDCTRIYRLLGFHDTKIYDYIIDSRKHMLKRIKRY